MIFVLIFLAGLCVMLLLISLLQRAELRELKHAVKMRKEWFTFVEKTLNEIINIQERKIAEIKLEKKTKATPKKTKAISKKK